MMLLCWFRMHLIERVDIVVDSFFLLGVVFVVVVFVVAFLVVASFE